MRPWALGVSHTWPTGPKPIGPQSPLGELSSATHSPWDWRGPGHG